MAPLTSSGSRLSSEVSDSLELAPAVWNSERRLLAVYDGKNGARCL